MCTITKTTCKSHSGIDMTFGCNEGAAAGRRVVAAISVRPAETLALLVFLLLWPTLALAELALQPGDPLRATVTGLDELQVQASVGPDGDVDLGWLGTFRAAGKTPNELEADIRQESTDRIVKQYDTNGEIFIIQLDASDIQLSRDGYRPIVVGGDVANSGDIGFRPGLTIREAVSLAGGPQSRLLSDDAVIDPVQLVRWQSEFATAAMDHAEALVKSWRVTSELSDNQAPPPPSPDDVSVSLRVLDDLIAEQGRVRQVNQSAKTGQMEFFEKARLQAEQRLDILDRQQEELSVALAADEEEEERVATLVERGLAPGSRLAESRRNTVVSATRLLDVEEALAAAELALTRLQRDRDADAETRRLALLTEREESQRIVRSARIRMDAVSQYILSGDKANTIGDILAEIDYRATIYRRINGDYEVLDADKSTVLLPGDTVEVSVTSAKRLSDLTD